MISSHLSPSVIHNVAPFPLSKYDGYLNFLITTWRSTCKRHASSYQNTSSAYPDRQKISRGWISKQRPSHLIALLFLDQTHNHTALPTISSISQTDHIKMEKSKELQDGEISTPERPISINNAETAKLPSTLGDQGAAMFLEIQEYSPEELEAESEKVRRKIDWHIMPIVCLHPQLHETEYC